MTQSAQQAQSKEDNTYIVKSSRQSNAPILITIVALLRHVGYGRQWGSSCTVSVRTNRVRNKHKARSIILILININLYEEDRRIDCLHDFASVGYVLNLSKDFFGERRLL